MNSSSGSEQRPAALGTEIRPQLNTRRATHSKWIIFPENVWIKRWDMLVLGCVGFIFFTLPYQIGVSGGIGILTEIWWFVVNLLVGTVFFADTFLYFFRAYRDERGLLVFRPEKIRNKYCRTWFFPNLLSVLPSTVTFYVLGNLLLNSTTSFQEASDSNNFVVFLRFIDLFKLMRFGRVSTIMGSSDAVTAVLQSGNSQFIQFWKYVFLIIGVAHWFACIWCFVAFVEAQTFSRDLLRVPNWIGNWVENNAVEGGLNPVGWYQATDRYALSLFWAAQTITSIGYGT